MDTILFSLLILCGLTDSQGRVWRCHPGQLYAVELTLPEKQVCIAMSKVITVCVKYMYLSLSLQEQVGQTVALTNLLPTVHCVSPREAIEMMGDDGTIGKYKMLKLSCTKFSEIALIVLANNRPLTDFRLMLF